MFVLFLNEWIHHLYNDFIGLAILQKWHFSLYKIYTNFEKSQKRIFKCNFLHCMNEVYCSKVWNRTTKVTLRNICVYKTYIERRGLLLFRIYVLEGPDCYYVLSLLLLISFKSKRIKIKTIHFEYHKCFFYKNLIVLTFEYDISFSIYHIVNINYSVFNSIRQHKRFKSSWFLLA